MVPKRDLAPSAEEQGRRLERPKRRLRCRVGYSSGRFLGHTALVTASGSRPVARG